MEDFARKFGLDQMQWEESKPQPSYALPEEAPRWVNLETGLKVALLETPNVREAVLSVESHNSKKVTATKDAFWKAAQRGRIRLKGHLSAFQMCCGETVASRARDEEDCTIHPTWLSRFESADFKLSHICFVMEAWPGPDPQTGDLCIYVQSALCDRVVMNLADLLREFRIGVERRRGAPEKYPWGPALTEFLALPPENRTFAAAVELIAWNNNPPSDLHLLKKWRIHMAVTSLK
jgi:hypothetical protein